MRPKKVILSIILIVAIIAAALLGFKFAKKVRRHFMKPNLYNTQADINALSGSTIQQKIKVFAASSLDRVFLDAKTLLKPSFSTTVSISAAGNEYESFQILVQSAEKELAGVYISALDLVNQTTGDIIPKSNITWRVVGYVPTMPPYYTVKFVGLWPDPLIPVKSYDVKAGTTQPFWLTVYVPPQTKAGDYKGAVIVKGLDFEEQVIPLNLRVYNFTLPKENHLKTAFDFYGHITKVRYPQRDNESNEAWHARLDDLNDKFIVKMLQYRMNPILNIDPTSQSELSTIDRYRALGLNNFAIGRHGGTFDNNWPKDDPSIEELKLTYQTYGEHLKLNNLLDYTYLYTWDEGDMDNPLVPKIASMVHRAYPGLKNMVCYHGIWDPKVNPSWGKDIDIWTFRIENFDEDKLTTLKKLGIEIWMYVSGPTGLGTPNLAMDFDSIDYRILTWMCWKYDIRGFLYWCVNWWPTEDPFKNARNAKWDQNGNGLLFYPGDNEPWVSLRMEIFRDGMEDYEYVQTLIEKLRVLRSQGLEEKYKTYFAQSLKLLTMDESLIQSPFKFTKDAEHLKSRRNAIAKQIEMLN